MPPRSVSALASGTITGCGLRGWRRSVRRHHLQSYPAPATSSCSSSASASSARTQPTSHGPGRLPSAPRSCCGCSSDATDASSRIGRNLGVGTVALPSTEPRCAWPVLLCLCLPGRGPRRPPLASAAQHPRRCLLGYPCRLGPPPARESARPRRRWAGPAVVAAIPFPRRPLPARTAPVLPLADPLRAGHAGAPRGAVWLRRPSARPPYP